jgi:hypothetical protein
MTPPLRIDFDEEPHRYLVNGEHWPSVTEILARVGLVDFSSIPEGIRRAALSRGSRVHKAAHYLLEGTLDWDSVAIEEKGYVEACAAFTKESGFESAGHERRVAHPRLRYAGTADAFGWFQGEFAIPDWCTGNLDDSCKHLQTSAYAEAMRLAPPIEWFDFVPSSPIVRIGVHLKKNGSYSVEVYRDPRDFQLFTAAAAVAHEQIRRGMKGRKAA